MSLGKQSKPVAIDPQSSPLQSPIQPLEHLYVTCQKKRIAEGVVLPTGAFAMRWIDNDHSHGTYPTLDRYRQIQSQMSGRVIVPGDASAERTFYLQRNEDWNGISGTGVVAVGFEFEGMAVLQWRGKEGSTFWYESVAVIERVHGHEGRTLVVRANEQSERTMSTYKL